MPRSYATVAARRQVPSRIRRPDPPARLIAIIGRDGLVSSLVQSPSAARLALTSGAL